VADSVNGRIQIFDKNGKFLSEFGEDGAAPPVQLGASSPYGDPSTSHQARLTGRLAYYTIKRKSSMGDFFQGRVQVLDVEQVPEPSSLVLAVLGVAAGTLIRKNRQNKRAVSVTRQS